MPEEIADFLQQYPPFSLLPSDKLEQSSHSIETRCFEPGHDLLTRGGPPASYLYIVRRGRVDLLREDEEGDTTLVDTLGTGDVFGHPSLLSQQAPDVTARSREQTLLYLLPSATFQRLYQEQPAFGQFFASSSLERLTHGLHSRDSLAAAEFRTHLRDLMQPAFAYVSPATSVREAARLMRDHSLACVIVDTTPPGIVTDRDLRNRVLAEGLPDGTPVAEVMSSPMLTQRADSLVFEGLMTMFERRIRHLPILEGERVIGVVTHSDILRQQSRSPLLLPRQLKRARTIEDFRHYAEQVTETVGALLDAGARVQDIGRVVAIAHDALIERLLHRAEAELGPPPCAYAWLVLGSEGRYEQTIRTDQDNALIYADHAPRGAEHYFSVLAERIVGQLVECGFPRCHGDVMATNPRWRRPLHVWQSYFEHWIQVPDEEALLRAAIFFDYRSVYGALDAEAALRPIIQAGGRSGLFLTRLSKGALRQPPPLTFFRNLAVERDGEGHEVIDLKVRGTALIVDIARLFAIAAELTETNTIARLRQAAPLSDLSDDGAAELVAAFELISLLRLRHQYHQLRNGEQPTNHVQVEMLSGLERRELKEAMRAVGRMQRSVANLFGTAGVG